MPWFDQLIEKSLYTGKARKDAFLWHAGITRKYTGEPYIHHNAEMVGMFYSLFCDELDEQLLDECCSIIWLHDVMEDCDVTREMLADRYPLEIWTGVEWLSDINQVGNRAERKRQTRARLAQAPDLIQTIKCLDLWSNATNIFLHDKNFSPVFASEAELLIKESLTKADYRAKQLINDLLIKYRASKEEKKCIEKEI